MGCSQESCEDAPGDKPEDMQERAGQEDEAEGALGKVRDALLHDCDGHLVAAYVTIAVSGLRRVRFQVGTTRGVQTRSGAGNIKILTGMVRGNLTAAFCERGAFVFGIASGAGLDVVFSFMTYDQERSGVDGGLGYQSIGGGYTKQSCYECGDSEEEEVVMEAWGLA